MSRRYEQGVIVGEPDPPMTPEQILAWCNAEAELARKRRDSAEMRSHQAARAYLSGRQAALNEVAIKLDAHVHR